MAKLRRLLIATDGEAWFVRRIGSVTEELSNRNRRHYVCDKPIGRRFKTLAEAARKAKSVLANPRSRAWR